jgi:hypothetical protein
MHLSGFHPYRLYRLMKLVESIIMNLSTCILCCVACTSLLERRGLCKDSAAVQEGNSVPRRGRESDHHRNTS